MVLQNINQTNLQKQLPPHSSGVALEVWYKSVLTDFTNYGAS